MGTKVSNFLIRVSLILACIFPFLVIIFVAKERFYNKTTGLYEILFFSMYIVLFILLYKFRNIHFSNAQFLVLITLICIVGVAFRVVCIFLCRTVPTSDFLSVYNASINNNHSAWKYISKYQYLYYQAKALSPIYHIFGKSYVVGQLFNCVLSLVTIIFLYFTGKLLFDNKIYAIIPALFFAIDPTMSVYSSVLSGEHFAISSLVIFLSIFLFASRKDNRDIPKVYLIYYGLSGFMLAVYNMFKPVAIVFIMAFLIAILVMDVLPKARLLFCKNNIKRIVLGTLVFSIIYFSTVSLFSFYFKAFSNFQNSSSTYMELLYNGLVFEGKGVYNRDVKNYVKEVRIKYNNNTDAINKELLNNLKAEFAEHKAEYYDFIKNKIKISWDPGIQYITWALKERQASPNSTLVQKSILSVIFHNLSITYYIILSLCCILGAVFSFKRPTQINKFVYTLYLVMFGVFVAFLLIEAQGRYKSVFHPAFIIIGSHGIMQTFSSIKEKSKIINCRRSKITSI